MKISYNWLKTLVNIELPANEVGELLTAAGLEVESIEQHESVKGGLKGLVVGHVLTCEKHPDADRLRITTVDIGAENPLSIVCGAPNVAAGQKVIVATVGTQLYPFTGEPFEIKKSKIRGAVSEGMLCAEDEIGLGEGHAGIMVLPDNTKVGMKAAEYFRIETDQVFEIGLTPNRSDAASHLGVARDLVAIINSQSNAKTETKINLNGVNELPEASKTFDMRVDIKALAECPRYSGVVLSDVRVGESPDWLKNRLRAIGVRPINNIVDISNFVLHELGQPLHAFDVDKISGQKIVVRLANEGEKFVTLDGVERTLKASDLMICDEHKPMCIAGVFGGLESGVTERTSTIFIESAWFDAGAVRRSSRNHGLKTDASFRFERGTDPDMTITALKRCANLIMELAGGSVSMPSLDIYPEKAEPYKVAFSFSNCHDLIGKEIDRSAIVQIIRNLGITIQKEGNDGLLLAVPRYKTDVTREADVIEEVMRIYGYNNVEVSKSISYTASNVPENKDLLLENKIASALEGFGFSEMMGLSLTNEVFYPEKNELVHVLNPLSSDLGVLRKELLFGGLEAVSHNINRKNSDLKLFEFGKTYAKKTGEKVSYQESKKLLVLATGNLFPQNPYALNQEASLPYIKSIGEGILTKCGQKAYQYRDFSNALVDFGLTCIERNKEIFNMGSVNKSLLKSFGIQQAVFFAEFNLQSLQDLISKKQVKYSELSKYPSVRRDLALLINRSVRFQEISDLAYATEKKILQEVNLFDVYEDEKLGDKKSYAVSFTLMNHEATLTDKQIDAVMEKLIKTYKEKLGAELR